MKIRRQELYERVWQEPLTKLAKQFDISDVGLAKACRKHAIPTPPVGYWAKVAHGKTVKRPALPKSEDVEVVLEAASFRADKPPHKAHLPPVAVPVVIVSKAAADASEPMAAPVTATTADALARVKPDTYGFVRVGSASTFSCVISAKSIERAVKLFGAIERALPSCGIELKREREKKQLELLVEGERLTFTLTETYRRKDEVKVDPQYTWAKTHVYTYVFSGQLQLTLSGDFQGRKLWSDGTRSVLEDKLGSFVAGIVEAARAIRSIREALAAQRRHWEEESKRHQIEAEKARRLKAFTDNFVVEASAWARYQQARAYLELLKSAVTTEHRSLPLPSQAWLEQAERSIGALNPADSRVHRLLAGYEPSEWLAPFGETVVPTR